MNKTKFDVVVVGSIGVDTSVYLHREEIDFTVETNFTENLDSVGGGGGYASRGYAQLGKRTAIIAHVGNDHNGRFIRAELAQDGIDTSALFIDPMGTSRSVNIMYPDGRRKGFYDGKGHMTFKPEMARCRQILAASRLAHFNLWNWTRHLLPIAKDLGLTIACDLQDVVSADDPYRQDFIDHAEILFFSCTNLPDPTPLIEQFLARQSPQIVIAGMGSKGCAVGTQDGIQFFPPVAIDTPIIDTTGAGDGLAVGFLSSFVLDGYPLHESIRRGQITARYTCSQRASNSTLITAEQLEAYSRAAMRNE